MHLTKTFSKDLSRYLSRSDSDCVKLIKFHDTGSFDFSFPISLKIWFNYAKVTRDDTGKFQDNVLLFATDDPTTNINQAMEKLKSSSTSWVLLVQSLEIKNYRCQITINKAGTYKTFLNELSETYGRRRKAEDETLSLEIDSDVSTLITQYRLNVVKEVVKNLLSYSKFVVVNDPSIAKHKILVTSKSNLIKDDLRLDRKLLTCGAVIDPATKKISQEAAKDYLRKRSEDMHLISIHKYGVRVKNDEAFKELVDRLGRNAVTLDLLEVKQSAAVTLHPNAKHAFIMYNSARLETLMEKFELKVAEGYYKELPNITDIDTSLLKENEEWDLLKLLLSFPDVIDLAIDDLPNGRISLHLIHKYISALIYTFSIYYRRVRLLTENRNQLMPTLHAKIHFLRVVQRILNESLAIFSIEPVAFM
jgi:DALR anticodon binding domain